MGGRFHEGERAVQERAGVRRMADRVAGAIHAVIPDAAREFVALRPFALLGGRDDIGRVWASAVWGAPGFLHAPNESTLEIAASPPAGDPLGDALAAAGPEGATVGVLVIDPATRRRMRLNGRAYPRPDGGGLTVRAEEVYANCPKYIQRREVIGRAAAGGVAAVRTGNALDADQRARVAAADTFFIATAHPEAGADVSHRGGEPGFVRVSDDGRSLLWPDYSGNAMFNTLGNLAADDRAGLLFIDWSGGGGGAGGALQLTGTAEALWDAEDAAAFPGAERVVAFRVAAVRETAGAVPLRFDLRDRSPFNPPSPDAVRA